MNETPRPFRALACIACALCLSIGILVGHQMAKGTSPAQSETPSTSAAQSVSLNLQEIGMESVSTMFPKGITGCWRLSDGTLLLEGPEMYGNLYARFYPQYDKACYVSGSEWICTVKEISDHAITFVGRGNGNCAMWFPFVWRYDIDSQLWSEQEKAYLSASDGVELGLNLPNASQGALLSAIHVHDNLLEINWRDTSADTSPYFNIRSDPKAKQFIVEIPDTAVDPDFSLPLSIDNGQGLVRTVHAVKGTSRSSEMGLTVVVSLDSSKWSRITYGPSVNPVGGAETARVLGIAFYDDREPTDLTSHVPR